MGNSDHRAAFKLLLNQPLDFLFSHHIDVGSRLVQDDDLRPSQDSTAYADKLPFSGRQVISILQNIGIESLFISVQQVFQLGSLQHISDPLIACFALRIQIKPQCATKNGGILWDNSDAASQVLKLHTLDIYIVNDDLSFDDLDDSCERQADRTLAGTCAADDSDLLRWQGSEAQVV